ncbi:MAG: hypothetical protein HOQ28_02350 [Thermoleophilia bacterium]|nr:hypothetical protein [Thermoleophilia bacterium]
MQPPVEPTQTKHQGTTRVRSWAVRSEVRPRDDALVQQFVFDYARCPKLPGDGPARWALLRARVANLAAQAQTGRQPWGSETAEGWQRRTAAQALLRIARVSSAARLIVRQAVAKTSSPRSREIAAGRRGTATALGGDSGDRPRRRSDLDGLPTAS